MATESKPKSNRGGPRPNTGRKPKVITDFNRTLSGRLDDALYALNLHTRTMRDTGEDLRLRLECAVEVMNRILGKPRQAVEVKAEIEPKLSLDEARELVRSRHRSRTV